MSRRRREAEKAPDLGFEIPEFDEAEFIRKETISFRTTLILFLYSVATALLSFLVWVLVTDSWLVSLLVAAATGYLLRFIYPALKVDIAHFGKKEWTGTGFLYFFSWLAFFIFFTNPPIYDGVAPTLEIHVTPDHQEWGAPVNVTLVAFDNVRVDPDTVQFAITSPSGTTIADTNDLYRHPGSHDLWSWTLDARAAQNGTYTIHASIEDTGTGLFDRDRLATQQEATITIGPAITVLGAGRPLATTGDEVQVVVPPELDVYRVVLVTEHGTTVQMAKDPDSSGDRLLYVATAEHEGFQVGTNNFTVRVEEHDQYFLSAKYGIAPIETRLVSATSHTVDIPSADLLGDKAAKAPRQRDPLPEQTPGAGAALTALALVGAALLVARRRRA